MQENRGVDEGINGRKQYRLAFAAFSDLGTPSKAEGVRLARRELAWEGRREGISAMEQQCNGMSKVENVSYASLLLFFTFLCHAYASIAENRPEPLWKNGRRSGAKERE